MESKPFLLRFKFRDFVGLPSTPGKCVYSDRVYDRRNGNGWQLQLFPSGIGDDVDDDDDDDGGVGHRSSRRHRDDDDIGIGIFLHNVVGDDVYASTAFVLRDARGGTRHRASTNDVDRYATGGSASVIALSLACRGYWMMACYWRVR